MYKSILITGCSSGIGLEAAIQLKKRNYQVVASARKMEDVEKLRAMGFHSCQLDLADPESVKAGWEEAVELVGGKISYLFNNGAYAQPGAVEDLSRDLLREQFEINVFGWHQLTCLAISHMRDYGYGRIVQNSSVLGLVSMPFRGAYNASKYAIEGLTDTMRLELRDSCISISLIEPGPILSEFRANALEKFDSNIDTENSHFKTIYKQLRNRLKKDGPAMKFTLGPDAVVKKLFHALESKNPKARYYVTTPTYVVGFLKRILTTKKLDQFLYRP